MGKFRRSTTKIYGIFFPLTPFTLDMLCINFSGEGAMLMNFFIVNTPR